MGIGTDAGLRRCARQTLGCALAIAALGACGGGGGGGSPPAGPPEVAIVDAFPALSFEQPLFLTHAPDDDGRLYVATRSGVIHVFDNDPQVASAEVFLDISERVDRSGGEMGLLGLAFDPAYAQNGTIYVNYTAVAEPMFPNRRTKISSFAPLDGEPLAVERQLLSYDQPYTNHNGGWIGFGPDGRLYIASGDGGSAGDPDNNAQRLDTLLGKMLRIDTDGGVPGDNPFVGDPGARGEIWAYGLRNPFRASFDRATGALWAADVGQNDIEEIDVIERGGNYGWRKFEGTQVFNAADPTPPDAIAPVYEYDHANDRCSITGGYVYRGSAIPALVGEYVFADFCSGELWSLQRSGDGVEVTALGTVPGNPSSFGEDAAGELYVTSFDGKIYKLVPP